MFHRRPIIIIAILLILSVNLSCSKTSKPIMEKVLAKNNETPWAQKNYDKEPNSLTSATSIVSIVTPSPSAEPNSPTPGPTDYLFDAVTAGDIKKVKKLLADGADVNGEKNYNKTIGSEDSYIDIKYKGWTVLHEAVENDNQEIIKLLIASGAKVNVKTNMSKDYSHDYEDWADWTPLHMAAEKGNVEICKLLISSGADINARGAHCCYIVIGGADHQEPQAERTTPLHLAAACSKELVKLLLEKGANVNVKDSLEETPLYKALHNDAEIDAETVRLLISKGADVNNKNIYGQTPLSPAIKYCEKELVRLLIDKGADVNVKDASGWSLLHEAVRSGKKEIVQLLIDNGADVNVKDGYGQTPLDFSFNEIKELLLKHGAVNGRKNKN